LTGIAKIEGIGATYKEKLATVGIKTLKTAEAGCMLRHVKTCCETGIPEKMPSEWVKLGRSDED